MKQAIPLQKAERWANQVADALRPYCHRLEIAGSIRRRKPFCGDIDIVVEPADLEQLRARIIDGKEVVQNGNQNIHVRLANDLEIQVFMARPASRDMFEEIPSNWGSLLLLRTGSKEHNIFLAQTARANMLEWKVYEGLFKDGKLIASDSEEAIFKALYLDYVPPQKREIAGNSLAAHIRLPST
ncbi:MAG TPA: hypothetical protein VM680_18395 [Verrucomicrobiae bacterium]|nr:hypothetical protein [Verrucomicrobiae bacterium]